MHVVIVAAGDIASPSFWRTILADADHIICADGGYDHCVRLEVMPHSIIGDFDSVMSPTDGLEQLGTEIIRHPTTKDHSDSELAVDLAATLKPTRITLLGGYGDRPDHSFANMKLLSRFPAKLWMKEKNFELTALVHDGDGGQLTFSARRPETVSILPIACLSQGKAVVSAQGLRYPVENLEIDHESHGLSNEVIESTVTISVQHGAVLICRSWDV